MSQHFKLPLRQHEKVPYVVVDAEGVIIGQFGRHGDGDQAGAAIAQAFVSALNGEADAGNAEDAESVDTGSPLEGLEVDTSKFPPVTRRRKRSAKEE